MQHGFQTSLISNHVQNVALAKEIPSCQYNIPVKIHNFSLILCITSVHVFFTGFLHEEVWIKLENFSNFN